MSELTEDAVIISKEEVAACDEDWAHIRDRELEHCFRNPFWGVRFVGLHMAKRLREKITKRAYKEDIAYQPWIESVEAKETYDETFDRRPLISVLIPTYNIEDKYLIPCLESVINQIYDNWELCISDDCSTWDNVKATLEKYRDDPRCAGRIRINYREKNGHISRNTNSCLEMATGEYIALLDCDDILRENALYEMVKYINRDPELDFIYSDEDKITDDGSMRHIPHFKPGWSPETLLTSMYTCHLGVYRTEIARRIGGFRPGLEGSQDYDFTLRFTEACGDDHIAHIPQILYHWRERIGSTAESMQAKPYVYATSRRAKEDAMARRGLSGHTEPIEKQYQYRIVYDTPGDPTVSVIICSKDHPNLAKKCIDSIRKHTDYDHYEIILVDNGSSEANRAKYEKLENVTYIYDKSEFNFSRMCNTGAKAARGQYLLFLNDDITVPKKSSVWMTRLLGQATVPHTGAVGARLLYPGFMARIQHCGIVSTENGIQHLCAHQSDEFIYYFGKNRWDYNYIAVTGACLMIERGKFEAVGGFDETFPIAYNDVDLGMKLVRAGYYNCVRNDAVLIHAESKSRGHDMEDASKKERLDEELERLYERYPEYRGADPFFNPNIKRVTFL